MRDLYQQGIQAAKERKWDEALKLYDQALALDPAFPLAKAARAEAERDRQVHIKMAEVNQLLGQQKFEEAVTLAQALPPSSTFDKEIVLLRKRVKDEMIKTSLSKAEAHIKEKKFQEARQAIEAAETADPSSESVKRLKADLASAETEQKRAAIRVKKVADDQAGARRGRWMDAYMKGYLAEAAEHLRRGGDEKTAAKADQVKSSYERGLAAYQEGGSRRRTGSGTGPFRSTGRSQGAGSSEASSPRKSAESWRRSTSPGRNRRSTRRSTRRRPRTGRRRWPSTREPGGRGRPWEAEGDRPKTL